MSLVNPLGLDSTQLFVWGLLLVHVVADSLQNTWMVVNKPKRGWYWPAWAQPKSPGPDAPPTEVFATRSPALVDARGGTHYAWWNRHPAAWAHAAIHAIAFAPLLGSILSVTSVQGIPLAVRGVSPIDVGELVRFAFDQTFHVVTIAIFALAVTA